MNRSIKITLLAAIGVALLVLPEIKVKGLNGLNIVSEAKAEVGRPLSPTSVAGVSRRTSRRDDG